MARLEGIDLRHLPRHVGVVMDGNGRWATKQGLARTEGHAAGEHALFDTVEGAVELGLGWLTVYAFSTENWKRPLDEVRYLMQFNESILTRRRDELDDMQVRIRFAGRRDWRVPRRLLRRMDESIAQTAGNRGLTLTILVVRTSGEHRISNFLLWELAYSELVFTDVLWPDFRREHLRDAIAEYQRRERRFGGVEGEG